MLSFRVTIVATCLLSQSLLLLLLWFDIVGGMNLIKLLLYLIYLSRAYRRRMPWMSCSSCNRDFLLHVVAVLCLVLEAKEIGPSNGL